MYLASFSFLTGPDACIFAPNFHPQELHQALKLTQLHISLSIVNVQVQLKQLLLQQGLHSLGVKAMH